MPQELQKNGVEISELNALVYVTLTIIPLVWLAFLPRIYVRAVMLRKLRWDDGLMTLAVLLFTVYCVSLRLLVQYIFVLLDEQSLQNFAPCWKALQLSVITYMATSMVLKIALAVYFFQFSIARAQRWTIVVGAVLYLCTALPCLLVALQECGTYHDPLVMLRNYYNDKCISWKILGPLNYVSSGLNCATDVFYVSITMCIVYKSKMNKRQRISASVLILLGSLGTICTFVRLGYIEGLAIDHGIFPSPAIGQSSLWEIALGIIAASLATLKPLSRRFYTTVKTVAAKGSSKEGIAISVEPIHGVGILSGLMSRTGLSTMSSAILRRIRKQDFAVYGEDMSYMRSNPTYHSQNEGATRMMETIDERLMGTKTTQLDTIMSRNNSAFNVRTDTGKEASTVDGFV